MSQTYYSPSFAGKAYTCPHCGVYCTQVHKQLHFLQGGSFLTTPMFRTVCEHCERPSYWYEKNLIIPTFAPVPLPHPDMPEDVVPEYNEARDLVARSPRAAAALMRLALQKLMPHLGQKGKNINDDIGGLVAAGLPVGIQQALDICRVVGNSAVHPGELDIRDSPDIAQTLFGLMNGIIEDRIARPKAIEALWSQLPPGAREAIEKRDAAKAANEPTAEARSK